MKKYFCKQMAVIIILGCFATATHAQFFVNKLSSNNKRGKIPTVITADSMDFNMKKNIAVFSGNVHVDDVQMTILCRKMIIYFVDDKKVKNKDGELNPIDAYTAEKSDETDTMKKDESKNNSKTDASKSKSKIGKTNKKVKSIVCLKDVVIIHKVPKDEENKGGTQKAVSDKAVYDVPSGKITLTIHPELHRGKDVLKGKRITFWLNDERLNVEGSSKIEIHSNPNVK